MIEIFTDTVNKMKAWQHCITWTLLQSIASKAQRKFGDEVLDLKLRCCHGQLASFPMVTSSSPTTSRALLPVTSKAVKSPLETEPAASDNNTKWTLKPGHQTFDAPHSTHNRSYWHCEWKNTLHWMNMLHWKCFYILHEGSVVNSNWHCG